jgi:hypothetical protein
MQRDARFRCSQILAATESRKRWDTAGKSFELNAAATKGGESAHWNNRTSYSYPRVYPEKIETWHVIHNLRGQQISGLSSFDLYKMIYQQYPVVCGVGWSRKYVSDARD